MLVSLNENPLWIKTFISFHVTYDMSPAKFEGYIFSPESEFRGSVKILVYPT